MAAHHHHEPPPPPRCPRCDSSSTKFCYYNSYDLSQPRYFCKDCRRYWTQREVPPAVRPRRLRITISDTETSSSPHDSLNLQDPERNIRSFVIVGGSTVKAKTGVNRRWETGTSILCPMDNQQQKYELPTNVGPEYRDGYVYNSFGGEASTKRHHPYVPQVHIDILSGKDQIDTETSSSPHDSLNPQGKPEPDTSLRNQNRYNSFGGGKDPIDVEKGNNGQTDLVFDQAPNDYRNQLKNSKFNDDATKIVSGIRDFPLVDINTGQLHCCPSGYVDDDILTRTDPFSVRSDPWSVNNRWETHASISGSMDNHQQQRYALPSNVGPEHMNGYGYNSSGGETSTTRHHSYAPQVHIDIFNGNGEIDGDLPLPAFRYHRVARLPEKNFDVDLPNYEIIDFHPIWKVLTSSTTVEIIKHLPKGSFTKRGRKFRSILRPNRVAGSGFWKATGIDMPIRASNVKTGRAKNRRQTHTSILDSMIYQQWQQYALPSNVGPEHMNGYGYNSSGGETSTTRDHSYVPQVHIDIIDEINQIMAENGNNGRTYLAIYQAWNEYKNRLKNSKFDDDAMNIMSGIFVAVAGQFVAGVMANRLTSSASSSSWAAPIVELATVFGLCVTLLGISLRAKSRSLSTLMIKIGAVTTAWAIIFSMGSHIPPAMAWTVGPVAFLIMAVAAAFA